MGSWQESAATSAGEEARQSIAGRLVLGDRVLPGRVDVVGDRIATVTIEELPGDSEGPFIAPGFVDVHVHGWGGHDAMGDRADLEGMAIALFGHGVTSFLPTAETAPLDVLREFAERVRAWSLPVRRDLSEPLGFNLEGPFIAPSRAGAQNPAAIRTTAATGEQALEGLLEGLRIWTMAPEVDGALDLISWLAGHGVTVSLGHSNATADDAAEGFKAGARSTTHLFNAMSGLDHHAPGLAAVALVDDRVATELIADGLHVDRLLWPLVIRSKPASRLILVSDAVAPAGTGDGPATIGGLPVEVRGAECRLTSDGRLAGSVIALDSAVRNLVSSGVPLPLAVRAASRNPLELIGVHDRGRIAPGQLADLVELDEELAVTRVMKRGRWQPSRPPALTVGTASAAGG